MPANPADDGRSDLALPTLMRAARGTYARSIRSQLRAIGIEDLPKNGAFILFGVHRGRGLRGDLPAGLGVSKQAVSQVVDTLVNRGYLERDPDPSDRRRITLTVTDRGQEVVEAVWRGTEAIDQALAARVPAGTVDAMRTGLMALGDIKDATTSAGTAQRRPVRRFRQFSPIFPVRDVASALAHYASLGFETIAYEDGADYGFANREHIGLHLTLDPDHDPTHGSGSTYLYVADADALFEEWSRPGIGGLTRPVGLMPYGLREGSHVDPDGNLIRFGSPVDDAS
jgi:DNA-binding MarR family transcriptional regulator/catechol 2,3-dioxygenase-like lactoylglutathione lyase family enzyme